MTRLTIWQWNISCKLLACNIFHYSKRVAFCRVLLKYVRFPRGLVAKKGEEGILTPVV